MASVDRRGVWSYGVSVSVDGADLGARFKLPAGGRRFEDDLDYRTTAARNHCDKHEGHASHGRHARPDGGDGSHVFGRIDSFTQQSDAHSHDWPQTSPLARV